MPLDCRGRLTLAAGALAAGIGVATAQPVIWRDTGLYHASVIRWLSEHGIAGSAFLIPTVVALRRRGERPSRSPARSGCSRSAAGLVLASPFRRA